MSISRKLMTSKFKSKCWHFLYFTILHLLHFFIQKSTFSIRWAFFFYKRLDKGRKGNTLLALHHWFLYIMRWSFFFLKNDTTFFLYLGSTKFLICTIKLKLLPSSKQKGLSGTFIKEYRLPLSLIFLSYKTTMYSSFWFTL